MRRICSVANSIAHYPRGTYSLRQATLACKNPLAAQVPVLRASEVLYGIRTPLPSGPNRNSWHPQKGSAPTKRKDPSSSLESSSSKLLAAPGHTSGRPASPASCPSFSRVSSLRPFSLQPFSLVLL